MASNPQKKHFTLSTRDFYNDYVKSCKKDKKYEALPRLKHRDFIEDVFAEIFHKVVKDSWHFVLPFGMGEFYMSECKGVKNMGSFSKNLTIRNGKRTYVRNDHTLRKTFKFKWDKTYARFPTAKYYKFVLFDGESKLHKRYKVGRKAISEFLISLGSNPNLKMIRPYNSPVKTLEEPNYET